MTPYKDTDIMPFGMHKGKQLANIPDDYFIYMYNSGKLEGNDLLRLYVEDSFDRRLLTYNYGKR